MTQMLTRLSVNLQFSVEEDIQRLSWRGGAR